MKDETCVQFLQWVLPQLRMRWPGFRRVHAQVCKRLQRRIQQLKLSDTASYREYLQNHAHEWAKLDKLCRITISRFYRDKGVFNILSDKVLPMLANKATCHGDKKINCWCAGCAAGEEAYTLALIWDRVVGRDYPSLDFHVTATDIDHNLLKRAALACYPWSSVKALPTDWLAARFIKGENSYCLDPKLRTKVKFSEQDIREEVPPGPFHLVLCRNLVFTYFDMDLQYTVLRKIRNTQYEGGVLVLGAHESLPDGAMGFLPWAQNKPIYQKSAE